MRTHHVSTYIIWALGFLLIWETNVIVWTTHGERQQRTFHRLLTDSLAYTLRYMEDYRMQSDQMVFYYENAPVTDCILEGKDGKTLGLKSWMDSAGDTAWIVFRYTELHCATCMEQQIALIRQVREQHPEGRFLIMTSYHYRDYFIQFLRTNQLTDMAVYRVPEEDLLGNAGVPFFFVLDRDMRYKNLFVPDKAYERLTWDYLTARMERNNL